MIIDSIQNLGHYAQLNPLFAEAIEYLLHTDLKSLPAGKIILKPGQLIVNVNEVGVKTAEEAKLETHVEFIDIQLPLTGEETIGYTPASELPTAPYDADNDIAFYPGMASSYLHLVPGMFGVFFPSDGHAPGITDKGLKKIIVKVKI